MRPKILKYILVLFSFLLVFQPVISQDTLTKKEIRKAKKNYLLPGRNFLVEIPLWLPGFQGTFNYGTVKLEGEDGNDPGDGGNPGNPGNPPPDNKPPIGGDIGKILNRLFTPEWYLRFFYIGKLGFHKNRVLAELDAFGGEVGGSIKFNLNDKDIVSAKFSTVNTRLIVGYRLVSVSAKKKQFRYDLFLYAGVRGHFHRLSSDLNNIINRLDFSPSYYLPIVGIRNELIWPRWRVHFQADFAATSFPDNYALHFNNFVYYRSGRFISLKFGWNHIFMSKEGVFLNDPYKIRITLSGPVIGLTFHI